MFTGIVQAIGEIAALEERNGDLRLTVRTGTLNLNDVARGDSIAVNGICLTVIELTGNSFSADVSAETIVRSAIKSLRNGSRVNLEMAVTPTTHLGGHLVSGHIDGVGKILARRPDARSVRFQIAAPDHLARYIAEKGSICVDGVSLTVNSVNGANFDLNIIPHTVNTTIINEYRPGHEVNLEVDIIARYLERLLLSTRAVQPQGITRELLATAGFR